MKRITLLILGGLMLLIPAIMLAGNLDSPASLGNMSSAMYTLGDIFNLLDSGTEATKTAAFDEPGSEPAATGKSLDEVYARAETSARVEETGAGDIAGYTEETNEDGTTQRGVPWPSSRFTDNSNGTITDNLTGLMWAGDANIPNGTRTWDQARGDCESSTLGGHSDWRLPNVKELQSLIDFGNVSPALPTGHPFDNVQSNVYWSSTTYASNTSYAWAVDLSGGFVSYDNKASSFYVWPVRGGQ